jgi:hypothetical protein
MKTRKPVRREHYEWVDPGTPPPPTRTPSDLEGGDLFGASRTEGGILRGKALGNNFNFADNGRQINIFVQIRLNIE